MRSFHLAHTYSIVACDPSSGQLGVAVQSHYFGTGVVVPWVQAGVGAVATQSFVDVSYGPLGLALRAAGKSASQALAGLLAADPQWERRQVAMVDIHGNVAAHTGAQCIAFAGHRIGEGYSVQANLMAKATVWDAMAAAYEQMKGDLAERMMAALEAAESEDGDIRGQQSAAMVVVNLRPSGPWWADRLVDLRVDDHPEPLVELRRLLRVRRAYDAWDAAEALLQESDVTPEKIEAAQRRFAEAPDLMPNNPEGLFWFACALAKVGQVDAALPLLRQVYEVQPIWRALLPRLVDADLLPQDPALLQRLMEAR
ncbi:MAG: DUF1028 domain-containing protein [Caldilinea sp.]|nr:DUF1028 domain-containing protein [Caldilinea sp.]MDW8440033.1 DUF1028 domain-containing protein [Caldilineaceae bacterium]